MALKEQNIVPIVIIIVVTFLNFVLLEAGASIRWTISPTLKSITNHFGGFVDLTIFGLHLLNVKFYELIINVPCEACFLLEIIPIFLYVCLTSIEQYVASWAKNPSCM
jgi:heme/copper-type cytochrome/quinol oxidase subunit 1